MPSTAFWAGIGTALGVMVTLITTVLGRETIALWVNKIQAFFSPYIQITIPEYAPGRMERSDLYPAVEAYLYKHRGTGVRMLTAELGRHTKTTTPVFCIDNAQEIIDTYPAPAHGGGGGDGDGKGSGNAQEIIDIYPPAHGDGGASGGGPGGGSGDDDGKGSGDGDGRATLWWHAYTTPAGSNVQSRWGVDELRFYRVSFHRRFRNLILKEYLPHVIEQGRVAIACNRQQRIFTNNPGGGWSSAAFQHPATFGTLAMDLARKNEVIDDLNAFMERKDYYAEVGKPWKRGYLLYGPPGTGKSTMVSVMANHLGYDVYDLELTAVQSNSHLRRLFIETTEKSIIVVEDIDRSVDLTGGKRVVNMQQPAMTTTTEKKVDAENGGIQIQQLTLSGLLNFIDGLWSACGGERIIVFTTNNIDKLDPALIRPGRMDKQIEMSYCTYEGFKVLARNYLGIINDEHDDLFERYDIPHLLKVANITPADVAEHLMRTEKHVGARLDDLVKTLKSHLRVKEKGESSKQEGQHDQEE